MWTWHDQGDRELLGPWTPPGFREASRRIPVYQRSRVSYVTNLRSTFARSICRLRSEESAEVMGRCAEGCRIPLPTGLPLLGIGFKTLMGL